MAQRAVKGAYGETGEIFAQRRRKDVAMTTEIRSLKDRDGDGDKGRARRSGPPRPQLVSTAGTAFKSQSQG